MNNSRLQVLVICALLSLFNANVIAGSDTSKNNREFVLVMLNHDLWPKDLDSQKKTTKILQKEALEGPLSQGFELIHKFETIPALSGWLYTPTVDEKETRGVLSRSEHLVADNNILKRIDLDRGGRNIPVDEPDSGGGDLTSSIPTIGANRVHKLGIKGQGIEIGILDTGIDTDHPDLANSVGAQQCFCFNPSAHCCPNGNAQQSGSGSAEDDHNHGSHVSGIVGSNGTLASVGVAPEASITMVKIIDSNNRFFSTSDIVQALDWLNVNRPGLDVVNMSLGTFASFPGNCDSTFSWTQALYLAVQNLVSKGVVVIASSGNNALVGRTLAPACLSNVVTVGAVNNSDIHASFSNIDHTLDLFAPGVSIVSSIINDQTASFSGTSMASPHVVGLAALIKQASPNLTKAQIVLAMKQNGIPINGPNSIVRSRIDAYPALCSVYDCPDADTTGYIPAILNLIVE